MTTADIKQLIEDDLFEVGAHTFTHTKLSNLTTREQRKEIILGREVLEGITGEAIKSFAYPYGTKNDYNQYTLKLLREYGFTLACTTNLGYVEQTSDLFQLERCAVFNWDLNTFIQRFENFFLY